MSSNENSGQTSVLLLHLVSRATAGDNLLQPEQRHVDVTREVMIDVGGQEMLWRSQLSKDVKMLWSCWTS